MGPALRSPGWSARAAASLSPLPAARAGLRLHSFKIRLTFRENHRLNTAPSSGQMLKCKFLITVKSPAFRAGPLA